MSNSNEFRPARHSLRASSALELSGMQGERTLDPGTRLAVGSAARTRHLLNPGHDDKEEIPA